MGKRFSRRSIAFCEATLKGAVLLPKLLSSGHVVSHITWVDEATHGMRKLFCNGTLDSAQDNVHEWHTNTVHFSRFSNLV